MHLAGCIPMKMFLVSYEEILNDVTSIRCVWSKSMLLLFVFCGLF